MKNNDLRNEFESEQTNEKFSLGSEMLEDEILLKQGLLENDIEKIAIMQKVEKKAEKYRKKTEKSRKETNEILNGLLEDKGIVNGALIAKLIRKVVKMYIVNNQLYLYDAQKGFFELCTAEDFSRKLYSLLDESIRLRIKSSEYKEVYRQILISSDLVMKNKFFANKPYVNCLNGMVNVKTGMLLPHTPEKCFKNCIMAEYIPGEPCPKFLEYVNFITNSNEKLKNLLQAILGYCFSHYNNAKTAFVFYSKPHRGKSVLCRVIEMIAGEENVSHIDLSNLQKQEYAAALDGMLLNIVSDLKNVPLKDVGFFKSLISHDDTIAAKRLYKNPGNVRGESKMIFATNHYIEIDSSVHEYDVEAVFNRLIYFPFQNKKITEENENKHLSEELYKERDGIFTWAMQGLRTYVENGENFPSSKISKKCKIQNIAKYCPEKIFYNKCIEEAPDKFESVETVKDAFEIFNYQNKKGDRNSIGNYICATQKVKKIRKRIDENGDSEADGGSIWVFKGIRLKDKYRPKND